MQNYQKLENQSKRISRIGHAQTFLSWDQSVMMPPGGAESRAESMAELSLLMHELITAPQMREWFDGAQSETLQADQLANLREMNRKWKQATCIPAELVEAQSLAASKCEHAWRTQRKANDWKGFLPNFEAVVKLAREEAAARLNASEGQFTTPYEAMLDLYAEGDTEAFIAKAFAGLKQTLPELVQAIQERQKRLPAVSLTGHYPAEAQKKLSLKVMEVLGFNFDRGRLDVSTHPFSTGVHGDHRITTRFDESEFVQALMATVHETGHASYEAHLPAAWKEQPVGRARSMSLHESQSLLFEKQIFLSEPFIEFLTPEIHRHFPGVANLNAQTLLSALKVVEPGYIRVHADEVTYPLHVILRYEIESALINGHLEPKDMPDAWNEKMQHYLGLSTEGNYKDGCMQDIHWPSGSFGYFPSYTLGALNAAQIFAALQRAKPDLDSALRRGDLKPIRAWLQSHIWSKGSFLSSPDLMRQATGETTNAEHFIRHIQKRYLD